MLWVSLASPQQAEAWAAFAQLGEHGVLDWDCPWGASQAHGYPARLLVPAVRLKVGASLRLRPLQESIVTASGCF